MKDKYREHISAMQPAFFIFWIWFAGERPAVSQDSISSPPSWKQIAILADKEINESSGLILSHRNDKCFWTHNDSGDEPRIFLVHPDGRTIARVRLLGSKAIDWEDITMATIGGTPKIIVGDIGGNAQPRKFVTLYILTEPKIVFDDSRPIHPIEATATSETTIEVSFQGGVTNYEGIAVDHAAGLILIVEKALLGGRVYSVPLPSQSELTKPKIQVTAKEIGHTSIPFACACDISHDSMSLVVITYQQGYLFRRQTISAHNAEEWSATLKREPVVFSLPKLKQPESVCFSKDDRSVFLTSEQLPTPIVEVQLPSTK